MKQTIINIPSFQGQYKTGLVFSMIDGLRYGEGFRLVCDQNPEELVSLLGDAAIPNVTWSAKEAGMGKWEIDVKKTDPFEASGVGCCGVCGGGDTSHKGSAKK